MRKPAAPITDPAPIVYVIDDDPSVRAALEDLLASTRSPEKSASSL